MGLSRRRIDDCMTESLTIGWRRPDAPPRIVNEKIVNEQDVGEPAGRLFLDLPARGG
jgi:hypothetical protein